MCGLHFFLSTLLFLLALSPHAMILHAQDTEEEPDSVTTTKSMVLASTESLAKSTPSEDPNSDTTEEPEEDTTSVPNILESDPLTVSNSSTVLSTYMKTDPLTTSVQEFPTTTERPITAMTTINMGTTIMTTTAMMKSSIAMIIESADLESTTNLLKDTTVATAMHATSPAVQTNAPSTEQESIKASTTTFTLLKTTEELEPSTTSSILTDNILTTLPPVVPTSDPADFTNEDTEEPSTSTSVIPSSGSEATILGIGIGEIGSKISEQYSVPNWLLILIIPVAIICIVAAFCVIIVVRRKKKSRSQRFGSGYMNGRNQRSKKKKGEEDAWAGPVNLEGRDKAECDGPDEMGQGGHKDPDGTDFTLSTFVASEANDGVGRPGSMEAQKWEEQEPLLYIDDDTKAETKKKQNGGMEKEKEVGQKEEEDANRKTETKEVQQNGGEAFCLTTAV